MYPTLTSFIITCYTWDMDHSNVRYICKNKGNENAMAFYVARGINTQLFVIKHLAINWNLFDDHVKSIKALKCGVNFIFVQFNIVWRETEIM